MRLALEQARLALAADEVPVGAVVAGPDGAVVAAAHDERMARRDPTAHAEILAMRRAAEARGDWRLEDCDLYVTLEPCPMCAGAIVMARMRRVVYGAVSVKSGAVETHLRLLDIATFNHRAEALGGVLAEECGAVLTEYFRARRKEK
jgi:tRNA(adenine34) deaminase